MKLKVDPDDRVSPDPAWRRLAQPAAYAWLAGWLAGKQWSH
jgi:hypothetical protein